MKILWVSESVFMRVGQKHSEASLEKMRQPRTAEQRRRISEGAKRSWADGNRVLWSQGKPLPLEVKEKISASHSKRRPSLHQRIWSKVIKTADCWYWTGYKADGRYGYILDHRTSKQARVTRLLWEMAYGPIPKAMLICHTCDEPACVRIHHLYLGTPKTNALDRQIRGRWKGGVKKGFKHPLDCNHCKAVRKAKQ